MEFEYRGNTYIYFFSYNYIIIRSILYIIFIICIFWEVYNSFFEVMNICFHAF